MAKSKQKEITKQLIVAQFSYSNVAHFSLKTKRKSVKSKLKQKKVLFQPPERQFIQYAAQNSVILLRLRNGDVHLSCDIKETEEEHLLFGISARHDVNNSCKNSL